MPIVYRKGGLSVQAKQIDMMRKVPDVLKNVREIKALINTENDDLNSLSAALALYLNNTFVDSADEYGIGRWESILGILPKLTDTLDERQFRVLSRINEQLPFTLRSLEQQLSTLCGPSGYTVELLNEQYLLKVRVELTAKSKLEDVRALLNRIVPANMVIDLDLLYNQHSDFDGFTHQELSDYTHQQLRDEVIKHG